MIEFIKKLPKAELHLHIEGTLEPELMFEMAKRNNISIRFQSVEEVQDAYKFHDLQSFLDIYFEASKVLIHEKDFYDLTMAYLRKCREDNVVHTEIFFDPQTHTGRGVPFSTFMNGISSALNDARREWGISAYLIMCFLRNLSEEEAMKTLMEALPFKDRIIGVGLSSSEKGNPPSKFKNVFQKAIDHGFLTVAHAGEEGPPSYVFEALDLLKVKRVDHGVRAIEDDILMERIISENIPLTVCPVSNAKLKVFKKLEEHNLKTMLHRGVMVTINSDDPAYFAAYANDNYLRATEALHLTKKDIIELVKNSFEASFMSFEEKLSWLSEIEDLLKGKLLYLDDSLLPHKK